MNDKEEGKGPWIFTKKKARSPRHIFSSFFRLTKTKKDGHPNLYFLPPTPLQCPRTNVNWISSLSESDRLEIQLTFGFRCWWLNEAKTRPRARPCYMGVDLCTAHNWGPCGQVGKGSWWKWWKSWKSAAVVREGKKRPTTVNTSENKEDGHLDFSWWMTRKKVRAPEYLRKKKRAPPDTFFQVFFDWQKRRKMDIPTCTSFPQPPCNAQEQMSTEFLACQSLTG